MNIYVNCNACKDGNGTKESPYRFINDAAQAAAAGDEILVAPGIYREYVDRKMPEQKMQELFIKAKYL